MAFLEEQFTGKDIIKRWVEDGDELQLLLADIVDCTISEFVVTFRLKSGAYIEIDASHEQGEVFVTLIEAK